jgi:signal transduction histidine kinase/ligand-binding sensor domain-containing protein/DNA-binding response OmpR family regulator
MKLRLPVLFLLVVSWAGLSAQNRQLKFSHLDRDKGLSQSNVLAILEDSRGFMWFSTRDGLNKFDGYQFTVYKNNTEDPGSLSNNYVTHLIEDSKGIIWITTHGGGLNRYDRQKDRFTNYRYKKNDSKSISDDFLNCVSEDSKGNLWIGTLAGGLNMLDQKTGEFTRYVHKNKDPQSLSDNEVNYVLEDSYHRLWIGTANGGLSLMDRTKKTFTAFRHDDKDTRSLVSNTVKYLYEDYLHRLWIGTYGGLDLLENGVLRHFTNNPNNNNSLTHNVVYAIAEDKSKQLWVGTENGGLSIFDPVKQTFRNYRHDDIDNTSLTNNSIYCIYRDVRGNMWLGTYSGGINLFSEDAEKFAHYKHTSDAGSLSNNNVLDLFEDSKNNLWIGTDGGGLDMVDSKGVLTHFRNNAAQKTIAGNYVLTIEEDDKENIWLGTWGDGLTIINKSHTTFTHFKNDPSDSTSISGNNVYQIVRDKDNEMWVGCFGEGLNRYDSKTNRFTRYKHRSNDANSLSNNNIQVLLADRKGRLWIGTNGGGLNLYDKKTNSFTRFLHDGDKNSLSDNIINGLFEDEKGNIWIGTAGGLNRLETRTGRFTVWRSRDGLPNDIVYSIEKDATGDLWLSTNKGLSRFNPETGKFKNFFVAEGLQSNEFNGHSSLVTRNGFMYFGGVKGFNRFSPDSIKDNSFEPPMVITGFQVFNRDVPIAKDENDPSPLKTSITETKEISLPYQNAVISFDFASLNYTNPEAKQYSYKLEGFDKNWNDIGNRHAATYTNLDPASYTFKVRARKNDGSWSSNVVSISLTIVPPFWMTWWFKLLIAAGVIGMAISFYKFRVNTIKAQKRKLEQQVKERTEKLALMSEEEKAARQEAEEANKAKSSFLAIMSHEIRTPMNGVIGMASLLSQTEQTPEQKEYTDTIRSCGEGLMLVINDILDYSKIGSGKMELEQNDFDLRNCIEEALDVFAARAAQVGLDLVYQIDAGIPLQIIGDRLRLRQVLLNLVSNALKFTESGEIFLKVSLAKIEADGQLELLFSVRDTGIGIAPDKLDRLFKSFSQVDSSTTRKYGGTGLGLAISEKLVELMGGKFTVESKLHEGSVFSFNIVTRAGVNTLTTYVHYHTEGLEGKRILVVDDNLTNRNILKTQLELWKFIPELAASGEEALQLISQQGSFDLVITDMQMPAMDGLRLANTIQKKFPEIPIILLSSLGDEHKEAYSLFSAVLTKPIKQQQLYNHVINSLNRKRKSSVTHIQPIQTAVPTAITEVNPLHILIAEDNLVNQKIIIYMLAKLGFAADIVQNGREAVEAVELKKYDIILMDVQMPEMDGLEATRLIRRNQGDRKFFIIAMTANAMQGDREECIAAGMDDYISKPISHDDLKNMLEKFCDDNSDAG